jgi:hypothetical protein
VSARPFLPNGCSRVPDVNFRGCCDLHDLAYYVGGSLRDKWRADLGLAACIAERQGKVIGWLYFVGVTLFGWTPWHWSYRRKPVPTREQLQALAGVDHDALVRLAESLA